MTSSHLEIYRLSLIKNVIFSCLRNVRKAFGALDEENIVDQKEKKLYESIEYFRFVNGLMNYLFKRMITVKLFFFLFKYVNKIVKSLFI